MTNIQKEVGCLTLQSAKCYAHALDKILIELHLELEKYYILSYSLS